MTDIDRSLSLAISRALQDDSAAATAAVQDVIVARGRMMRMPDVPALRTPRGYKVHRGADQGIRFAAQNVNQRGPKAGRTFFTPRGVFAESRHRWRHRTSGEPAGMEWGG